MTRSKPGQIAIFQSCRHSCSDPGMVRRGNALRRQADFPVADKVLVEKAQAAIAPFAQKRHPVPELSKLRWALHPMVTNWNSRAIRKRRKGIYMLDARNPDSDYFLSIHISYPNNRRSVLQTRGAKASIPGVRS